VQYAAGEPSAIALAGDPSRSRAGARVSRIGSSKPRAIGWSAIAPSAEEVGEPFTSLPSKLSRGLWMYKVDACQREIAHTRRRENPAAAGSERGNCLPSFAQGIGDRSDSQPIRNRGREQRPIELMSGRGCSRARPYFCVIVAGVGIKRSYEGPRNAVTIDPGVEQFGRRRQV